MERMGCMRRMGLHSLIAVSLAALCGVKNGLTIINCRCTDICEGDATKSIITGSEGATKTA